MAEPVIYDTDPGIDDAIALHVLLGSPELDVVALTSVFGNVETDVATANAQILLDAGERADIPVAAGASAPLTGRFKGPAAFVHGDNGLGDIALPEPSRAPIGEPAHELICRLCAERPGEMTILAVGPLTNLALALRHDPSVATNAGRVVIMGGNAYCAGNASPAAEANILNDPEAADEVFGAAWQTVMVGLDVTTRVVMTDEHIAALAGSARPGVGQLAEIVPFYRAFHERLGDSHGIHLHDPAAAAYLLAPDLFGTVDVPVRVETESFSRGKTWPNGGMHNPDLMGPWDERPPVRVCADVDGDAVAALVLDRLL